MDTSEKKLLESLGNIKAEIKQFTTEDVTINYVKAGTGFPLLLIHGANFGWGQWHTLITDLSQNYTVYAVDLPGFGNSTSLNYEKLEFNRQLVKPMASFVEKMGLQNSFVMGHSLGAWVGMKLVLDGYANFKKIILANPLGFSKDTPLQYKLLGLRWVAKLLAKTVLKIRPGNIKKFLNIPLHTKVSFLPEFTDYYHSISKGEFRHPFYLFNRIAGFKKVNKELILDSKLSQIHQPVLIIGGEYDPIVSLNHKQIELINLLPEAKIKVIKGVGHVPFFENRNEFYKVINEFLKK